MTNNDINNTMFKLDRCIIHPQQYRDFRWYGYVLEWYRSNPWYKRLFMRKPKYEDIAADIEKEIAKIRGK